MTTDDLITIAESFQQWLEVTSNQFGIPTDDLQEIVKSLLS